jgi:hypothetical protein
MDMDVGYVDDEEEDYAADEVGEMLGSMLGEEEDEDDLTERKKKRRKSRRPVPTSPGRSSYRAPVTQTYVTQKQLQETVGRVGADIRRNALGIKTVNDRVGRLDGRVDAVVSVNKIQSSHIGKLKRQMKLGAALDFAEGVKFDLTDKTFGVNPLPLFRGAVKSGVLGDAKGVLGSPAFVGAIGVLLNNLKNFQK